MTHKGTVRLETERLILRRFTMEDFGSSNIKIGRELIY